MKTFKTVEFEYRDDVIEVFYNFIKDEGIDRFSNGDIGIPEYTEIEVLEVLRNGEDVTNYYFRLIKKFPILERNLYKKM